MGAQESSLNSFSAPNLQDVKAYHVLRVADSSPAAEAGIEPFFDYIVGIGGEQVTEDGEKLANWLDEVEGKSITLQVYSSRKQEIRTIQTSPHRKWTSSSLDNHSAHQQPQPSLLGLSLRLCNPQNGLTNVWHVLDVVQGSPSQDAGLVPYGDWIIGYAGGILRNEDDLYQVVEEHEGRPLRLFVYNADYEVTREVVIVPNRSWGSGKGLLGCSIGFGLLHRIPKTSTQTAAPSFLLPSSEEVINSWKDERRVEKEQNHKSLEQLQQPKQLEENATLETENLTNNRDQASSIIQPEEN